MSEDVTRSHAAIVEQALVMALTGHEGGTVRQVERAIKWAMAQPVATTPCAPPRLPAPDPWVRHVYVVTGISGGSVSMNRFERERAYQRPWYRRMWGPPSQATVDSWGLNERRPF